VTVDEVLATWAALRLPRLDRSEVERVDLAVGEHGHLVATVHFHRSRLTPTLRLGPADVRVLLDLALAR